MTGHCQVTGAVPGLGYHVAPGDRGASRRVDVQSKRHRLPSEQPAGTPTATLQALPCSPLAGTGTLATGVEVMRRGGMLGVPPGTEVETDA